MKTLLSLGILSVLSTVSFAQTYTHQRFGNFDYYYGPNGYSGFGQQLGNQYYYNDNYGSGFGQRFGNTDYYNYTPYYQYRQGW